MSAIDVLFIGEWLVIERNAIRVYYVRPAGSLQQLPLEIRYILFLQGIPWKTVISLSGEGSTTMIVSFGVKPSSLYCSSAISSPARHDPYSSLSQPIYIECDNISQSYS